MSDPVFQAAAVEEDADERAALAAAVKAARAVTSGVSHEAMRAWLLEIAAGHFDAEPPPSRPL